MQHIHIDVVDTKNLQLLFKTLSSYDVLLWLAQLCHQPNLLARNAGISDSCPNLMLILVCLRCVDVAVASLQGPQNALIGSAICRQLPNAKAKNWEFDSIGERGSCSNIAIGGDLQGSPCRGRETNARVGAGDSKRTALVGLQPRSQNLQNFARARSCSVPIGVPHARVIPHLLHEVVPHGDLLQNLISDRCFVRRRSVLDGQAKVIPHVAPSIRQVVPLATLQNLSIAVFREESDGP
mmetsp:Transcript_60018/g.127125  ORF Transcript_60018/g.127125 Transcript_60018/m.127125 type:complete len:238 (+) Transcript_60018:613-1326(+)